MAYGFYKDIIAALEAEAKSSDHRGAGGLCRDAAAEIERLRAALSDARDALHNDFEPDNQSAAYKRASAALEQRESPK